MFIVILFLQVKTTEKEIIISHIVLHVKLPSSTVAPIFTAHTDVRGQFWGWKTGMFKLPVKTRYLQIAAQILFWLGSTKKFSYFEQRWRTNKPVEALVLPAHRRKCFHRLALSAPSNTVQHLLQLCSKVLVLPRAVSLKLTEPPTWQHDLLTTKILGQPCKSF